MKEGVYLDLEEEEKKGGKRGTSFFVLVAWGKRKSW